MSGANINTGNINTGDVNVNVDGAYGYGGCCYGGWGGYYHPVATTTAVATTAAVTTAAVMGSYYATLPSTGCVTTVSGGVSYYHCGSVWYKPVYSGMSVQYVVVAAP